jgi:hypothetical protein
VQSEFESNADPAFPRDLCLCLLAVIHTILAMNQGLPCRPQHLLGAKLNRPRTSEFYRRFTMCNTVGVAKRVDLESISEDIATLVKQLGKEVEGNVQASELRKIETKVQKIIKG